MVFQLGPLGSLWVALQLKVSNIFTSSFESVDEIYAANYELLFVDPRSHFNKNFNNLIFFSFSRNSCKVKANQMCAEVGKSRKKKPDNNASILTKR